MHNELSVLLKKVQSETKPKLTLEGIAKRLDVSRPYLNNLKLGVGSKDAIEAMITKLREEFPEILHSSSENRTLLDRLLHLEAANNVNHLTLIELVAASKKQSISIVASELKKAIANELEILKKGYAKP